MTQFNVDFHDIVSVDTTLVNGIVEVAASTRSQTVLAHQRWDCDRRRAVHAIKTNWMR